MSSLPTNGSVFSCSHVNRRGLSVLPLIFAVLLCGAGKLDLLLAEAPQPRPRSKGAGAESATATPRTKRFTIRGTCVDERGAPIANARVRVFRYPSQLDPPSLVADLRTSEDGKFATKEVESALSQPGFLQRGDLTVAATAGGHVSIVQQLDETALERATPPTDPFAPTAKAEAEARIVEISLVLRDNPGTLSGTITDESGKPIPGVKVFLPSNFQQPLPGVLSAVTDQAGRYAITDLNRWQAGDGIGVEKSGKREERMAVTSYSFLFDHPDYGRVMAQYTGVPQVVNITLHPPAIIEGAVVDAVTDRPAANVIVSAQGVARMGWYQTRADAAGRFRLLMTKDHYNIWAEADERIPIAAKAIAAEPGKTTTIAKIPLLRGAIVTGKVLDAATNEPLIADGDRPLYVGHYGPARPRTGAAVTSAEVDADGTYRLRIAPGTNYVYVMSAQLHAARVVTVKDGEELKLDLRHGEHAVDNAGAFAADLALAGKLHQQAAEEDARQNAAKVPPRKLSNAAARQRRDTPAGRLLDKLEEQNAGDELFKDSWCRTLKEIVDLGPAAVPELIEELDATHDDRMLRCLGFTLRAIGDKRAVPALIRAIPKTLRPPGSDMGLTADDPELLKFAQQNDLDPNERDQHYGFGRPVREICGALEKLAGQSFGEKELFNVFLDGLPSQRRMRRELYQRTAQAWAGWWNKNEAKRINDKAFSRVDLPELVAEDAKAPPPAGMHFKVNGGGGSGWVLESVLNLKSGTVFYDFDTGRAASLPDRWRTAKNMEAQLDEIVAWALGEGFDLMGTEYALPNSDERVFAIRSLGLRAWELGKHRWKMSSDDVTLEELQAEGTPAEELLLHREGENSAADPKATASFLYITREGTPGLLFVGIEVQDDSLKPGGRMVGDNELSPIAFRKGRRFGFKNFKELAPPENAR